MNVTELIALLEEALVRGLDPQTAVVIADQGNWRVVEHVGDPTTAEEGYIWFTLFPGEWADDRFTPGHYECDNDEDVLAARRAALEDDGSEFCIMTT